MTYDAVNKPKHYAVSGLEPIDVIEDWLPMWPWRCGFALANTVKYIARCGLKGTTATDLEKANWYVQRALLQDNTTPSAYGHSPTITPQEAADSWEEFWPQEVREDLAEAVKSLGCVVTRLSLTRAATAIGRAAYLAAENTNQLSFTAVNTLAIGKEVRVRYSTDDAVSAGSSATLLDVLDDVPSFKVQCEDGAVYYVEDVEAV